MANRWEKQWKEWQTIFLSSKITADGDHEITRCLLLGRTAMTNRQHIKKQKHYFAGKGLFSQSYGFSSSHVGMWELDYKESWEPKNWWLLNFAVGEDSWESLRLLGDQTSQSSRKSVLNIHWKDWFWRWNSNTLATWYKELTHLKRPWCWERLKVEEKGTTEDEMVGWHHWLYGHEFE